MGYLLFALFLLICIYGIYLLDRTIRRIVYLKKLQGRIESFLPDVVFVLDKPLRIVAFNRYSNNVFPFFYEELSASTLWELLPTEVATRFYKGYKDALDLGCMQTCRFSFFKDECTRIELELRFVPLQMKYILCILRILNEETIK